MTTNINKNDSMATESPDDLFACPECLGWRGKFYQDKKCPLCEGSKQVDRIDYEEWQAQD